MVFGYQSRSQIWFNGVVIFVIQIHLLLVVALCKTHEVPLSSSYYYNISSSSGSSLRSRRGLLGCDLFKGKWVVDNSNPIYAASSCPFINSEFDCIKHGRSNTQYLKYSWQPDSCNLPRYILISLSFKLC